MALELVTAPAAEPVTTAEAKTQVRVDVSDDDTYIDGLVAAIRRHVEAATKRALVTQTWDLKFDSFPWADRIHLPMPPLQSVTSISYVDQNGDSQTLASSKYTVHTPSGDFAVHGFVALAYNESWPTTRSQPEAVTIRFVAGYGAASAVPDGILQAIKMIVGHLYENRQDVVAGTIATLLPQSSKWLLEPYVAKRW